MNGESGDDLVCGDYAHSDVANGSDVIYGGIGNDTLNGGCYNAEFRYVYELPGQEENQIYGEDGNDVITGDNGWDEIRGGAGNDLIWGMDFADTLYGETGDDEITAGYGDDTAFGGIGNDILAGQDGADSLEGGEGDDWLLGGIGSDALSGGTGTSDQCDGGTQVDTADSSCEIITNVP